MPEAISNTSPLIYLYRVEVQAGMWISEDIRKRILVLADEIDTN